MKIGIIITVRTDSTRLPRKALMLVLERPIISYLISRLKNWNNVQIIICTTTNDEDLVLQNIAKIHDIGFFQGDPENIPKRHYECMMHFGFDFAVNVDGDDILCDPEYVNKIISAYQEDRTYKVIKTQGLPFGTNSMGYQKNVLAYIIKTMDSKKLDTGWGELINNPELFKTLVIEANEEEKDDFRLTLDYQEDFIVFQNIISNNYENIDTAKQSEIINYLRNHPEIGKVNKHLDEIYWNNYRSNKESEGR